jgi:hypothetical protein
MTYPILTFFLISGFLVRKIRACLIFGFIKQLEAISQGLQLLWAKPDHYLLPGEGGYYICDKSAGA